MTVVLPYPPSTNRMWRTFRGMTVLSKEGKAFKQQAALLYRRAGLKLHHGDVVVWLTLHPRMNKDGSASKTVLDLDNSLKAALDALQGVAYVNDRQIKALAAKYGPPTPNGGATVAVEAFA